MAKQKKLYCPDFINIKYRNKKRYSKDESDMTVYPTFNYSNIRDAVIIGGEVAYWWNGDEWVDTSDRDHKDPSTFYDGPDLISYMKMLVLEKVHDLEEQFPDRTIGYSDPNDSESKVVDRFDKYCRQVATYKPIFDMHVMFKNDTVDREDFSTRRLPFQPADEPTPAFDEILDTLYEPIEQDKILWFLGNVLSSETMKIQKFLYFYGGGGSGKGTILNIYRDILEGYANTINLGNITGGNDFGTGNLLQTPMLIDSDADLRHIQNDTDLLKITSHEPIYINAKYMIPYEMAFNGIIVAASNQEYQVRDVNAGINRRAVVVRPSGGHIEGSRYNQLMSQVKFEFAGIAYRAMKRYKDLGRYAYDSYIDTEMLQRTNLMFNFVRTNWMAFYKGTTLKKASEMYKQFLEDNNLNTTGYKQVIRRAFDSYFETFSDEKRIDGVKVYNVFEGFKWDVVFPDEMPEDVKKIKDSTWLSDMHTGGESKLDELEQNCVAQYANDNGTPKTSWDKVTTTLHDIDTTKIHYVQIPENHIVIDFDLQNDDGEKDLEANIAAASKFPPTYAETSKSKKGLHLHYIYDGDPSELESKYADHIEIKVFKGKTALRRKLTLHNDLDVAHISSGLPLRKENNMYQDVDHIVKNEKQLRSMIEKNLRKEYHDSTAPSIDFIDKLLKEAQEQGVEYDMRDLRNAVMSFAMQSTHQAQKCVKLVNKMKFTNTNDDLEPVAKQEFYDDKQLVFFDIEVYKNLFLVCWKRYGEDKIMVWYNPTPEQIESLTSQPLVGFNNRRYDNHILYARLLGQGEQELFQQSQAIVNNSVNATYAAAYALAYADIYDYNSKKQSLKKWEIEMGMTHDEFEFPWDQPLAKENWERAAEYCSNDVKATEALFKYTYADYKARCILAQLSGLPVSSTTNQQSARFLFGNDKRPQDKFVYTDLAKTFPGYKFEKGVSTYRGEEVGEGGYVYANPGVYKHTAEIDVASMHPSSLIALNYFGPYTERFKELKDTRILIKHKDFKAAENAFNGVLKPFLKDPEQASGLAQAMKIVINSVYGMTAAKFDNPFRHPKNIDNIIAKRGALFMVDLKHAVQEQGYTVVHIKTDSIKIANVDDKITKFVIEFGKKYGYNFEVEHIFDKMALVNKAVLIGHVEDNDKWGKESNTWEAIGAEFAEPYTFKTLFSHEQITSNDFAITKQVKKGTIYIDDEFIGKVAQIYASVTGGQCKRHTDDGKESFVSGTKGFKWKKFSAYTSEKDVDMDYYDLQVKAAINDICEVGNILDLLDQKDIPTRFSNEILPF